MLPAGPEDGPAAAPQIKEFKRAGDIHSRVDAWAPEEEKRIGKLQARLQALLASSDSMGAPDEKLAQLKEELSSLTSQLGVSAEELRELNDTLDHTLQDTKVVQRRLQAYTRHLNTVLEPALARIDKDVDRIRQKTTENKGEIDKIETEVASRPAVEEPGVLVRAWWLVRTVLMLLASAHAVFSIHQAAVHPATVHPSPSLASFPFLTSAAAPAPAYPTELGEEDSQPSCLEHPAGAQSRDNVQRSAREAGGDREEAGGDRARSDQAPLLSNIVAGGEVELLAMVGEDQHTSVQDGAHAGAREGHEEMEDGKDVGMLYPGPQSTVLCLCVSLSLCLSLRLRLFCVRLSVLCLSLCLCVCLFLYLGPASHLALGAKTAQSLRNFILQLQNTSLLSGDGRAR
eukprot:Tamp_08835.p1 GENE.Tamp_08835~~Tamp_08835.p1  ORF type:complete len:400 (-),score=61.08 Tamp_08835:102-1301(-)